MLKNPFVVFILAFGGAFTLYQLRWSELYPDLSYDLLAFFGFALVIMFSFGAMIEPQIDSIQEYNPGKLPDFVAIVLIVLCSGDILYAGKIPLIEMIKKTYHYGAFPGIPTLHVVAATFSASFASIRFADFLYAKGLRKLRYLLQMLIPLTYFAMINYRGSIIMMMMSWGFIYIIKRGGLGLKRTLAFTVLAMIGLFGFGAFGDARTGGIEKLGLPTQEFQESGIPRTYFWGYLYFTSPLANFQHTVDVAEPRYDVSAAAEFVLSEMLPDFISNRALPLLESNRPDTPEIGPGLNVATLFARSYLYFGWIGVMSIMTWFIFLIIGYMDAIRHSPYQVPCLALLNTLIFFFTFDNMIAQTWVIVPLIWPLLLPMLARLRRVSEPAAVHSTS